MLACKMREAQQVCEAHAATACINLSQGNVDPPPNPASSPKHPISKCKTEMERQRGPLTNHVEERIFLLGIALPA